MDEELYFDTRNKKGQKFGNFLRYKKEKSNKSRILLKRKIPKEKKTNKEDTQLDYLLDERWDQLKKCSWYRIRHHHHCHLCHPRKEKVNKIGKPKTIFRKKEYKNINFDIVVNK